jgi:uncharacterized damage-inducible protein DinB
MKTQQSIAQQFGFVYRMIEVNVEGMTPEQSLAQPSPGGNCANWIVGHLTNVQNNVMRLIGQAPVWESEQLANAGWEPITNQGKAIAWETMRDRILGSRDRCIAAISGLSDQQMAEQVPHPFGGTTTRAEALSLAAFHQAYHAGQLGIARRVAGLEGAVKGPGQPKGAAAAGKS